MYWRHLPPAPCDTPTIDIMAELVEANKKYQDIAGKVKALQLDVQELISRVTALENRQ